MKKKKKRGRQLIKKAVQRFRGTDEAEALEDSAFPKDAMGHGRYPLMSRYTGAQADHEAQKPILVKHTAAFGPKPAAQHPMMGHLKQLVKRLRKKKYNA